MQREVNPESNRLACELGALHGEYGHTGGHIMAKPKLTPEIKQQADAIVARFNAEDLRNRPMPTL